MTQDLPGGDGRAERFEYFMLRLTRSTLEPDRVTGLIELLGSGQKRTFDTGEQLVQLVGGRFPPRQNRHADGDPTAVPG